MTEKTLEERVADLEREVAVAVTLAATVEALWQVVKLYALEPCRQRQVHPGGADCGKCGPDKARRLLAQVKEAQDAK